MTRSESVCSRRPISSSHPHETRVRSLCHWCAEWSWAGPCLCGSLFPGALSSPLFVLGKNSQPRSVSLCGFFPRPSHVQLPRAAIVAAAPLGDDFNPRQGHGSPTRSAWKSRQRDHHGQRHRDETAWGEAVFPWCQSLTYLRKPCCIHVPSGLLSLYYLKNIFYFLNLHLFF